MIRPSEPPKTSVPPEEAARRIAEGRQVAFEHRMPPVVVYQPRFHVCPWDGCGYRIVGMKLKLEDLGHPELHEGWLRAFWLGPGLFARCPACHRFVRFDVESKGAASEAEQTSMSPLPDCWHEKAHLSPAGGRQSA